MKTIYIARHAKSSWKYTSIRDHDRPLKERGINDAHLISKHLAKNIQNPIFLYQAVPAEHYKRVLFFVKISDTLCQT